MYALTRTMMSAAVAFSEIYLLSQFLSYDFSCYR